MNFNFCFELTCGCSFLEMLSSTDRALGTWPELFQNAFTSSLASCRAARVELQSTFFPTKKKKEQKWDTWRVQVDTHALVAPSLNLEKGKKGAAYITNTFFRVACFVPGIVWDLLWLQRWETVRRRETVEINTTARTDWESVCLGYVLNSKYAQYKQGAHCVQVFLIPWGLKRSRSYKFQGKWSVSQIGCFLQIHQVFGTNNCARHWKIKIWKQV